VKERYWNCFALLSILKGRIQGISSNLQQLLIAFSNDLIRDGLIPNLSTLILNLTNQPRSTATSREIYLLSQCLFFICIDAQCNSDHVFKLVDTLLSLLDRVGQIVPQTQNAVETSEQEEQQNDLMKIIITIALAISAALLPYQERSQINSISSDDRSLNNTLFSKADFINSFHKKLKDLATGSTQQSASSTLRKKIQGMLAFVWSTCHEQERDDLHHINVSSNSFSSEHRTERDQMKEEAWGLVKDSQTFEFVGQTVVPLLNRPADTLYASVDRDFRAAYSDLIFQAAVTVLHTCTEEIRMLFDEEVEELKAYDKHLEMEEQKYRNQYYDDDFYGSNSVDKAPDVPHDYFESLLKLISSVVNPDIISVFWNISRESEDINTPLVNSLNNYIMRQCPNFIYRVGINRRVRFDKFSLLRYLELLHSLSSTQEGADKTFMSLKNSEIKTISWDSFFDYIRSESKGDEQARIQEHYTQSFGYGNEQPLQQVNQQDVSDSNTILEGVLHLLEQVLEKSSTPYVDLILENGRWEVLKSLTSMFAATNLPGVLMGRVFRVLAQLSKHSRQVAHQVWYYIEVRNMLVQTFDQSQNLRMRHQLEQVEAKTGCYHETLGFLCLLSVLIRTHGIPELGKGSRTPGFEPYLAFIRDDVFIKFDSRYYADDCKDHQWLMAQYVLEIIHAILSRYSPHPRDFIDRSTTAVIPSTVRPVEDSNRTANIRMPRSPGYEILLDLFTDKSNRPSSLLGKLKGVLLSSTITELQAERQFVQPSMADSSYAHENSIVFTLQILEQALSKQQQFIDASLSVTRYFADSRDQRQMEVDQISEVAQDQIIVVNPLDRRLAISGDFVVRMTEFMTYANSVKIRLCAIKIINLLCEAQSKALVSIFTSHQNSNGGAIMEAFVERLRGIYDFSDTDPEDADEIEYDARIITLQLLIRNVNASVPNVTHWLCGFSDSNIVTDNLERSDNCLTVVCNLIQEQQSSSILKASPKHALLMELCYELVYSLCADRRVSRATLAILERQGLFTNHSSVLFLVRDRYLKQVRKNSDLDQTYHHFMNQQAYILKIVALKIYIQTTQPTTSERSSPFMDPRRSERNGKSAVQQLVNILFNANDALQADGDYEQDNYYGAMQDETLEQHRTPILELLDGVLNLVDHSAEPVPLLAGEDLHRIRLILQTYYQQVQQQRQGTGMESNVYPLSDCTTRDANDVVQYNISAIYEVLSRAISVATQTVQSSKQPNARSPPVLATHDQPEIRRCVEIILSRAVQWNRLYQRHAAICNAFNGWKQVVEITLSKCYEMLSDSNGDSNAVNEGEQQAKERVLVYVLNAVLSRLSNLLNMNLSQQSNNEYYPERQYYHSSFATLQQYMSQVIMRLMTKLREKLQKPSSGDILSIDDEDTETIITEDNYVYRLPAVDQCISILNGILVCVLRSGGTTSIATRGNLYSTLLNYLQYSRRRFAFSYEQQSLMDKANDNTLMKAGTELIARIGRDALDGTNVNKAVAFATLDALFNKRVAKDISKPVVPAVQLQWIEFMERSGLLQQIIDHLCLDQAALNSIVSLQTGSGHDEKNMNKLYIYESIMSMLFRISSINAETLCKFNILHIFTTQFKFIDSRPSDEALDKVMTDEDEDVPQRNALQASWLPSIMERYHQLLLPVLRIIVSIFTGLRSNRRIAEQVLSFIGTHHRAISAILKNRDSLSSLYGQELEKFSLEEIKLVTALFYLLCAHRDLKQQRIPFTGAGVSKYEASMLNLLSRFSLSKQVWTPASPIAQINPATMSTEAYNEYQQNVAIEKEKQEKHRLVGDICKNIISYCRVETQHPLQSLSGCARILFTATQTTTDVPSLNVLFSLLDNLIRCSLNQMINLQQAYEQRQQQQREIYGQDQTRQEGLVSDISENAELLLVVNAKLAPYIYIIENVSLVLLRHLSHFYTKSDRTGFEVDDNIAVVQQRYGSTEEQQRQQAVREAITRLIETLSLMHKHKSTFQSEFLNFIIREMKDLLTNTR
jgi:hypothetical protein